MSAENEQASSSPTIPHLVNPPDETVPPAIDVEESTVTSTDGARTEPSPVHEDHAESTKESNDEDKPITTASHSRRVHFPVDDAQLRLISYATEPYAKQPLLSLGVILQRYRAACQRLQIRPLSTLLDQLSAMDDGRTSFVDRLDCLKIANERIDLKHIDAIEEILSRCRFHTLNLDSSSIDDAALTQLFDVIEYYESCTHINLSNNRSIGVQGYQALTKYLRKTNSLERLDMNATRFDDNTIISFTRSLRLSSTLYELHVESCQLNGKLLQKFIQNIRACGSLRELYLCDNRLQVQDSLLINELIRSCGSFLALLDLRSNALHDTGMSHLASQLSHYDENHKHDSNLQKISVQANQLTSQGVGFLAKSLLHNRTIRSLNLSQNNISNEGLFLLRDALLTNRTINELILRNCHLTDQAAIALAEFIAESTTIQYIDLRENNIQASGVCGMAIAIKNNKSLLKLDFDPIASTPTNLSSLSSNNTNNIDRASNPSGLLSLTNLRRMTTGFSSFTSNAPFQSGMGGGGTRELLEQKARWMNDIAAVCQRNILIYEERLRVLEAQQDGDMPDDVADTNQRKPTTVKPEDIELTVHAADGYESTGTASNERATSSTGDTHKVDYSVDVSKLNDSPSGTPTVDDHDTVKEAEIAPVRQAHEVAQVAAAPTDHNDAHVEQAMITPADDSYEVEQTLLDLAESVSNGDTVELNQNSAWGETSSNSDLIDDLLSDDKRKMHHSDSLYLLRKKVKGDADDDNDTSDDESQLSSSEP